MIFKKEHELLRKTVRDFVEREMGTYPEEVDKTGSLPKDVIKKLVNGMCFRYGMADVLTVRERFHFPTGQRGILPRLELIAHKGRYRRRKLLIAV